MSQGNCDAFVPKLENGGVDEGESGPTGLYWFRRCLRFHDNPALLDATSLSNSVRCVYIIDPSTIGETCKVETNKWRFLLESLHDLDSTLRKHNSRLFVLQGQPTFILPHLFKDWHVNVLSMEDDPSPYGARRDQVIGSLAEDHGVYVVHQSSHTLHPIPKLVNLVAGKTLSSLKQFYGIFQAAGPPDICTESVGFEHLAVSSEDVYSDSQYAIPTLEQLLGEAETLKSTVWKGGETEALNKLRGHLERRAWVACFDTPKMTAASLFSSPSVVGPYLTFGCLSPRLLYWKIDQLYRQIHGTDMAPPVSLHGQLILREFWYLMAALHRKFDRVEGNKLCLQVPWKKATPEFMQRIIHSGTGFPWIDAIMKQLVSEGWVNSMAKHSLISFITHGQLFVSWEEAAKLLNTYCLEGDLCINSGLAMLLSGSSLAKPIPSNVETPVLAGRLIDPTADFIRRYIPMLRSFPAQYIYEPWTAPLDVQQQAGCVIGRDYPAPMVDHYQTLHTNMLTIQQFLKAVQDKHRSKGRVQHLTAYSPYPTSATSQHLAKQKALK